MRLLVPTIALLFWTVPVAAQDLIYSDAHTANCAAGAELPAGLEGCIGLSSTRCQDDNGYATVVMSGCLSLETEWWDKRLNIAYQEALNKAREMDAENGEYAPSQAEAIRDMQRAWIPFRDATCSYEASQWGGGTGQGPAYVACLLQMTADQVIYLEQAGL